MNRRATRTHRATALRRVGLLAPGASYRGAPVERPEPVDRPTCAALAGAVT